MLDVKMAEVLNKVMINVGFVSEDADGSLSFFLSWIHDPWQRWKEKMHMSHEKILLQMISN